MNAQVVPDKTQLEAYLRQNLTQQQIADRWEADSGIRCSRSAIAMALNRYGLKSARPRERYLDLVPWEVAPQHRQHADVRLLRLEGRRRSGKSLNDREMTWLNNWRNLLEDENAVIMYDPRTPEGFYWVPRTPEDTDIVRRPAV